MCVCSCVYACVHVDMVECVCVYACVHGDMAECVCVCVTTPCFHAHSFMCVGSRSPPSGRLMHALLQLSISSAVR